MPGHDWLLASLWMHVAFCFCACTPQPQPHRQVSARIEELLHTAFENYFMLSEETASGMMDGALAVRSGIPAVLRPAVHLFSELGRVLSQAVCFGGGAFWVRLDAAAASSVCGRSS